MDINALLNQPRHGNISPDWSWQDFAHAGAALAEQLAHQPATHIALWFEDAARFSAALFAAWQAGKTVLLPPAINADHLAWIAAHNALLITDDESLDAFYHFRAADENKHADLRFAIAPDAELWLKTSGSSAAAKQIRKTCAQLCAEAAALAAALPPEWRHISAHASVSQQHLYGLTFRIFTALACDWQITRRQLRYPENLLSAGNSPCLWISSPALLNHFGEQRDWASLHPYLRGIISAGGALPEHTRHNFKQHCAIDILDIYGSSETGIIAMRRQAPDWQLFTGVNAGLDAAQCLWVESPWSSGREQSADQAILKGKRLQLLGRSDRIIKFADKRISLAQIEHQLICHDWVADAHCGVYGEHQRIAAWIALSAAGIQALREQGRAAVQNALKHSLHTQQERLALPRYWRFAQALPRNAQSKIQAQDFQQAFAAPSQAPQWQCLERSAETAHFQARVPLDLALFAGHFADFPLVAGALELQWVFALAEELAWDALPAAQIEQLKFQQLIRPDDVIDLYLQRNLGKAKFHFRLMAGEAVCASGRWSKA